MDRRLRDKVLVSWIHEGGQLRRTHMVIHTVILFDVPMPDEYTAIATMRPLNLSIFRVCFVDPYEPTAILISKERLT